MDSAPRVQRWLVTGASGFLGSNVGAYLEGGAYRIGLTRDAHATGTTFDEWRAAELTDTEQVARVVLDCAPDIIVHSAALASHEQCEADPRLAERVNALATGELAQLAQSVGAQFVLISTDAVFDGERGHYSEDDEPSPTSVYGRTKLQGELLTAEMTDALVVRTNFFGWSPSGTRSILEFFVDELSAERRVRGFTDFTTTSAYAQVLAAAIDELVADRARGTFHVTSPDALTKYEFGLAVAREFNLDADLISPSVADMHPPRGRDISLDVSKAEEFLGHRLATQLEGISAAHLDAIDLRARLMGTSAP